MNVQLFISFLVFLTKDPLTIKGRRRSRGGFPISSSLPGHDAKDQKDRNKRDKGQKQEKPRTDCKLAQKKYRNNNLYDA